MRSRGRREQSCRLRLPEITPEYETRQKDKNGWQDLCQVLLSVEERNAPSFTEAVFRQVLVEIHRRLAEIKVTYLIPSRISLSDCLRLVNEFLSVQSGGDRVQAVAAALFDAIGTQFSLYASVRREKINTADASSGQVADIECLYPRQARSYSRSR